MKLVEITRTRELPYAGTVEVAIGQRVNTTDLVAQMNYFPGLVKKLKVSKTLAIKESKILDVVCVKKGDLINEGELVAFNTRWHKLQSISAPHNGIIGMVSRNLGIVYLRKLIKYNTQKYEVLDIEKILDTNSRFAKRSISVNVGDDVSPGQLVASKMYSDRKLKFKKVQTSLFGKVVEIKDNVVTIKNRQKSPQIKAYLAGEVVAIKPNWSVTIKSKAYKIAGVYGLAGERSGYLSLIDEPKLKAEHIAEAHKNKIIFTSGHITNSALKKAKELEVAAIIGASCNLANLRKSAGDNFIPGITGGEDIRPGIAILNGFKASNINRDLWSQILKLEGCQVSINGTTHIRAGAIRPEILIFPNRG